MFRRALVVLLSGVVGLAACGGGRDVDTGSGRATATTAERARDTTASSEAAEGSGGSGGSKVGLPLSEQCQQFVSWAQAFGLAAAAATDPEAARQLEQLKDDVKLDEVPGDLRDDFQTMMDYITGFGKVLAEHSNSSGEADATAFAAVAEYMQTVDQDRLRQASDNIGEYVKKNCEAN